MRTMLIAMSMLISMIAFAATPTITGVTAQQRYPWNGKVDISYTVTGDIAAEAKQKALVTSLKVTATDNESDAAYAATAISGDASLTEGSHTIVWDMDAEGFDIKSSNVVFKIECETVPALYCVIDLSEGLNALSYPVTYLAEPPSGGFNVDEYKTTKLVLRKVTKGSNSAGGSMAQDMWVGIFEVTEQQYVQVNGNDFAIGGYYKFGTNPTRAAISMNSRCHGFLSTLKSRSGINVRLPSTTEWEYACRAGTITDYNNGTSATEENMAKVGWYNETYGDAHNVGGKVPNAWGMYDMHGNVWERTSNYYYMAGLDGAYVCGGSYSNSYLECTSSSKSGAAASIDSQYRSNVGLRVFAVVE